MLKLSLSHFGVSYSGIPAIVDLSFELTSATLAAVSGVLGAGKSSLLRAIQGRVHHSGEMSITDGDKICDDITIASPIERHMLKAETSVYQFVLLGLLQKSWSRPVYADDRIIGALARCGLLDKKDLPISALTPSEMRLAELAQLFVQNPKIILIDQPDVQINLINADYLKCLSSWVKEYGTIALVAVADVVNPKHFDQVIPLSNGHLQAVA